MTTITIEGNHTGAFAPGQEAQYTPPVETPAASPDNQVTPAETPVTPPSATPEVPTKDLILGKFKDREALSKSTAAIAEKLGVPIGDPSFLSSMPKEAAETMYKALEAQLGARKRSGTGSKKDILIGKDGELNEVGKYVTEEEAKEAAAEAAKAAAEEEAKKAAEAPAKEEAPADQKDLQDISRKLPDGSDVTFKDDGYAYEGEITDDDRAYMKQGYGDAMANLFEQVGLHAKSVDEFFTKNGRFPNEAYARLEKAGIPKAVVDSYLSGVIDARKADAAQQVASDATKATQEAQRAAAEAQQAVAIEALKKDVYESVGGEGEYKKVMEWAKKALSQKEKDAYDHITNTGDAGQIKIAAAGLKARYEAEYGSEPELISGGAPTVSSDVFQSSAQVVEAMSDPRYKKDPAYQRAVLAKLARSNAALEAQEKRKK